MRVAFIYAMFFSLFCQAESHAANAPLSGLTTRGTVAPTDLIPIQPVASATLLTTTPNDLLAYIQGAIIVSTSRVTGLGTFATQNYASPPAIGGTSAAAGTFTNLTGSSLALSSYPLTMTSPMGGLLYATQAYSTGVNTYQNNLAFGDHTLNPATHISPSNCFGTSGTVNFCGDEVAFGAYTLAVDVYGRDNTAIGDHALANNVSGKGNTAVGSSAAANITATDVVEAFGVSACQNGINYAGPIQCIGQASLLNASTASQYTAAFGYQAGFSATDAEFSTIVGDAAAYSATTNTYSIALGEGACHNLTSISNSICIGVLNGAASGSLTGKLWIGGSQGTATPTIYGDLTTGAVAIGSSTLASGAALTVSAGDVEIDAGKGLRWNNDVGFSRYNPASVNLGTGAVNDHTGTLALTNLYAYGVVRPGQTTYANLSTVDASPQVGDMLNITDASACTANTAVSAGGGTTHSCTVVNNGSGWIALVTH